MSKATQKYNGETISTTSWEKSQSLFEDISKGQKALVWLRAHCAHVVIQTIYVNICLPSCSLFSLHVSKSTLHFTYHKTLQGFFSFYWEGPSCSRKMFSSIQVKASFATHMQTFHHWHSNPFIIYARKGLLLIFKPTPSSYHPCDPQIREGPWVQAFLY